MARIFALRSDETGGVGASNVGFDLEVPITPTCQPDPPMPSSLHETQPIPQHRF